ncbi:MAG: hypothetical protein QM749_10940 [Aquabacterium sp.]
MTQLGSERVQGDERAFATACASPIGPAHGGKDSANAVDVTNWSCHESNHKTCDGFLPAGMIAPRSFTDTLTTSASGRAARSLSATVGARSRAADAPGAETTPFAVTSFVDGSIKNETRLPSAFGTSLPKIPDSAGVTPVWSDACPGAVSVTAYG